MNGEAGKGSEQRPRHITITREELDRRWEKAFGKNKRNEQVAELKDESEKSKTDKS